MTSELAEQFVGGYGFAARILYDLMVPSGSSGTGQHPRFCHGSGITDYGPESAKKLAAATLDRHKTQKYACASCPLGWGQATA